MFIPNKYTKWYFSIVNQALQNPRTIHESHHIIPKSLNGKNDKTNIVKLSPREHCICHLLLCKMVDGSLKHKMVFAALMMTEMKSTHMNRSYKINSKIYESLRIQRSIAISNSRKGVAMSQEQKEKLSKSVTGFKHTKEAKESISKNHRSYQSEETSLKISNSKKGIATRGTGWNTPEQTREKQKLSNKGKIRSEETRNKISLSQLGSRWINNGNCNKKVQQSTFISYIESGWIAGKIKKSKS